MLALAGMVSKQPVLPPEPVPGGILADEMGLGEARVTVTICITVPLACSRHPTPSRVVLPSMSHGSCMPDLNPSATYFSASPAM